MLKSTDKSVQNLTIMAFATQKDLAVAPNPLNAIDQVLSDTVKTGSTLKTMFRLGVGAVRA